MPNEKVLFLILFSFLLLFWSHFHTKLYFSRINSYFTFIKGKLSVERFQYDVIISFNKSSLSSVTQIVSKEKKITAYLL